MSVWTSLNQVICVWRCFIREQCFWLEVQWKESMLSWVMWTHFYVIERLQAGVSVAMIMEEFDISKQSKAC